MITRRLQEETDIPWASMGSNGVTALIKVVVLSRHDTNKCKNSQRRCKHASDDQAISTWSMWSFLYNVTSLTWENRRLQQPLKSTTKDMIMKTNTMRLPHWKSRRELVSSYDTHGCSYLSDSSVVSSVTRTNANLIKATVLCCTPCRNTLP